MNAVPGPHPDYLNRLLTSWRARNIPFLPGLPEAQVVAFESETGVTLPDDFRAYFLATNGLHVPGTKEADDRNYDFWPLADLWRDAADPDQLYFADYLQRAWQFAIELGEQDRGSVYVAYGAFIKIASSFAEFIDLYIADDVSLYPISWMK